jgi:L-2-hydroxyglutarate oxidase
MSTPSFDVVVIGGGIVGVATARALTQQGHRRVVVLETEPRLAQHQTGRNSGVIHAGLYYRPGSDKARLCAAGRDALYQYCEDREIPFRRCGKLVVATAEDQLPALDELERRAHANGLVGVQRLDRSGIQDKEPAANGVAGLWISETGIVDFASVTRALATDLQERDGEIRLSSGVKRIHHDGDRIRVETQNLEVEGRLLINCAGLQCDRVARLAGVDPQIRLIPFRGEYFETVGQATELVRGLIYPVPDPRFPFLGVHWTRTVDGRVLAGPNAVPAFKREGYRRSDISLRDIGDTLAFPGFWRLAGSFWRTGLAETRRSLNKKAFVKEARRLISEISGNDLRPSPSGVRAQAVDRAGKLLDDFFILQGERTIHVLNAPSPAATASLAIGEHIADLARQAL